MKVGNNGDTIITHALGSCLGLILYDPEARVGGLLHAMLPLSRINRDKAKANPYLFVDTGIPALFEAVYGLGAKKKHLVVKAAGCGAPLGNNEMFKIGQRNHAMLKKLLSKNNLMLAAEDVKGTVNRTVQFDVSTGRTIVSCKGVEKEL